MKKKSVQHPPVSINALTPDYKVSREDYQIAQLAWKEGLSAAGIAEHLGYEKNAENITKIRRSLQRAVRHQILQLNPPRQQALEQLLMQRFEKTNISVGVNGEATVIIAARAIAERISMLLADKKRPPDKPIVVANAGGRTVRDVLAYLQREVPLPPVGGNRIISLSLNAAEQPQRFDECANALCVRLAEIYGARHFASVNDQQLEPAYLGLLDKIDLMISSVGAWGGLLQELFTHNGGSAPQGMLGDLAFHVLNKKGVPIPIDTKQNSFYSELRVKPDWEDLRSLASRGKLLVVLKENSQPTASLKDIGPTITSGKGDEQPENVKQNASGKLQIARALLEKAIITDCVIDFQLGSALLSDSANGD